MPFKTRKTAFKRKASGQLVDKRRPQQVRRLSRAYPRVPLGMPKERWVRLKYVQEITLNPILGGIAAHNFRCNSLFDPDFTGIGHQPLHYDQVILPYFHYTVYGSKLTATIVGQTAEANIPGYVGIFIDDDATLVYTQASQIIESSQPQSVWRTSSGIEGGQQGTPKLSLGFSTKKFFGVNALSSQQFRAASNANPSEQAVFTIWAANVAGNDPAPITALIEIEYFAKLSELRHVTQS